MPLPALQLLELKFEKQRRLFELRKGVIVRKIDSHIALFEQKKGALERKIEQQIETHRKKFEQGFESHRRKFESQIRRFEEKKGIRLDDEVRFIRTWIEKPLSLGAVTPSSRALARIMASYVDPHSTGPVVELGPGTGPVTEALVAHGVDPARLVLVEFDPTFCKLLHKRYPTASVVQGDAYSLGRLLYEAFDLMAPGAPFVQFTYAAVSPIPKRLDRVSAEPSERVWVNIPPARVWVYRRD